MMAQLGGVVHQQAQLQELELVWDWRMVQLW